MRDKGGQKVEKLFMNGPLGEFNLLDFNICPKKFFNSFKKLNRLVDTSCRELRTETALHGYNSIKHGIFN